MGGLSKDPKKKAAQIGNLQPPVKGERRNPRGRPKGSLSRIVEEMNKQGLNIVQPTKGEIRDALLACTFGTEEQLKNVVNDKQKPMFLRIVAREVLTPDGYYTIEKILDRVIGKKIDITSNDKTIKNDPLIVEIIDKTEDVEKPGDADEDTDN